MPRRLVTVLLLLVALAGCTGDQPPPTSRKQCSDCHSFQLDANHQFACTTCHLGKSPADSQQIAHEDLISRPAHPDTMERFCGPCHEQLIRPLQNSLHATLHNLTNTFRSAYGATEKLDSFLQTPSPTTIETPLDLADDLLRRRCFRCHLFSPGDEYSAVHRGTGCAACHLPFSGGHLTSHAFTSPGDRQCLSCHYGNYVGYDYYGRFEQDYHREYRTPFIEKQSHLRPYGVEFHQLEMDIHKQKGLGCIDCHSSTEIMASGEKTTCDSCHSPTPDNVSLPPRVTSSQTGLVLIDHRQQPHPIPLASHPAHTAYGARFQCQACHARWMYNDTGKHYLRDDSDDFDRWWPFIVQGSSEIEFLIENNTDFAKDELPSATRDKLSGKLLPGMWLKAYGQRRWEPIILGRDGDGTVGPVRPLLDYRLSWIDSEEMVRFDSIAPDVGTTPLRPYTPHTTGAAGIYYETRLAPFSQAPPAGK